MPEFTVELETSDPAVADERVLEFVAEHLVADEQILGPAASLDHRSGTIGARFQVRAGDAEQAADVGTTSFLRALASAGVIDIALPRVYVRRERRLSDGAGH